VAIDTIEALMERGTADSVRLKAAETVLDRIGVRGGFEVSVEETLVLSATDEVRRRLERLGEGARVRESLVRRAQIEHDVVDGELVEEDSGPTGPAQEALPGL
jgi:predicted DNA-binding protein (UPF0278 family)